MATELTARLAAHPDTEVGFLPVADGQRFWILHSPAGRARGAIVYLPPFAEEMNRTRLVVARMARAFATAGYAVLQMDLHGCGDSSGEFGEASWAQWRSDALLAVQHLQARHAAPLCLWGVRSGALLASEVARALPVPPSLLFWQPVLSGRQHLQQFLRLSLAASLLDGRERGGTEALQASLASGKPVEIAGYSLAPALAEGLAASELAQASAGQRMYCIEVLPGGGEMSPALRRFVQAGSAGSSVCDDAQSWLTPDIQHCPNLEQASLAAMKDLLP